MLDLISGDTETKSVLIASGEVLHLADKTVDA